MSWVRPTRPELLDQTQQDLATAVPSTSPWITRSLLRALAAVTAGAADILHAVLERIVRQIWVHTADDAYIETHARELGLRRRAATAARLTVEFAGDNATVIPTGTELVRADGWRYETQAEVTITGGVAEVAVTATDLGAGGNMTAGELLLGTPIAGVASATVVGQAEAGADEESFAALRARTWLRKRQQPQGGAEADYIAWLLAAAEAAGVWVEENTPAPGDVAIFFVVDGTGAGIIPGAGLVSGAQTYIDAPDESGYSFRRPVTAFATVYAPTAVTVAPTIEIVPDTSALRTAVTAALDAMCIEYAGRDVPISAWWVAIGGVPGLTSFELTVPSAATTVASGETVVRGTVTWS